MKLLTLCAVLIATVCRAGVPATVYNQFNTNKTVAGSGITLTVTPGTASSPGVPAIPGTLTISSTGGGGLQTNDPAKLDRVGGYGTNLVVSELVATNASSTNVIYVLPAGDPKAAGNYYLAIPHSGLPIWTNANASGYAVVKDCGAEMLNQCYTLVSSTNGADLSVFELYGLSALQPQGVWYVSGVGAASPAPGGSGYGTYAPSLSAVGAIQGDGRNLTNLVGNNIVAGSIPATALASGTLDGATGLQTPFFGASNNGAIMRSGNGNNTLAIGNFDGGYLKAKGGGHRAITPSLGDVRDGRAGVGNSMFVEQLGGNISGAQGGGIHGYEMARRSPKLPFFLYGAGQTESFVKTNIQGAVDSGKIASIVASGYEPWVLIETGWQQHLRDSNNDLQWNTNAYPSGPVAFMAWLHARGVKISFHQYAVSQMTNKFFVRDDNFTVPGGTNLCPATTLQTVTRDVNRFYTWGVDAFRNALGEWTYSDGLAAQQQMIRAINAEILDHGGTSLNQGPWFTNLMVQHVYLGSGTFFYPPSVINEICVGFNDQGQGTGSGNTMVRAVDQARVTYTNLAHIEGQGHFMSYTMPGGLASSATAPWASVDAAEAAFTYGAMFPGWPIMPGYTNAWWSAYEATIFNAPMSEIYNDPDYAPAFIHSDEGIGGKSVMVKPLSRGGYGVALGNETGTNYTFTFDWSTNIYSPRDFYAYNSRLYPFAISSNHYFTAFNTFRGTNVPISAQAWAVTVPAGKAVLVRMFPAPVGFATTATLATRAILATNVTGGVISNITSLSLDSAPGVGVQLISSALDSLTIRNAQTEASTVTVNAAGFTTSGAFTGGSFSGTGSGLTALNADNIASGTLSTARTPAFTGDVTKPAGSGATTLAAGSASVLNSGTLSPARVIANSAFFATNIPSFTVTANVSGATGLGTGGTAAMKAGTAMDDYTTNNVGQVVRRICTGIITLTTGSSPGTTALAYCTNTISPAFTAISSIQLTQVGTSWKDQATIRQLICPTYSTSAFTVGIGNTTLAGSIAYEVSFTVTGW